MGTPLVQKELKKSEYTIITYQTESNSALSPHLTKGVYQEQSTPLSPPGPYLFGAIEKTKFHWQVCKIVFFFDIFRRMGGERRISNYHDWIPLEILHRYGVLDLFGSPWSTHARYQRTSTSREKKIYYIIKSIHGLIPFHKF